MKLNPLNFNPQKFNPFKKLLPPQDESGAGLASYDESVLQQGRFWMRTVTWSLIGTTVFGVAWLALARTEEIVVAPGQLEPIGSVQDIQMPAVLVAVVVGGQQLMGFTRAWFGYRSDRIPPVRRGNHPSHGSLRTCFLIKWL